MNQLSPRDPRNPRIPVNCPRCAVGMTYLGTFPKSPKADPWASPLEAFTDPANTHVYRCITHGRFWLNAAVGLKAARKRGNVTENVGDDQLAGSGKFEQAAGSQTSKTGRITGAVGSWFGSLQRICETPRLAGFRRFSVARNRRHSGSL